MHGTPLLNANALEIQMLAPGLAEAREHRRDLMSPRGHQWVRDAFCCPKLSEVPTVSRVCLGPTHLDDYLRFFSPQIPGTLSVLTLSIEPPASLH